jgi:hypothetical protein
MGAIDLPKNVAGDTRCGYAGMGITAHLSCSFNFLTIRAKRGLSAAHFTTKSSDEFAAPRRGY